MTMLVWPDGYETQCQIEHMFKKSTRIYIQNKIRSKGLHPDESAELDEEALRERHTIEALGRLVDNLDTNQWFRFIHSIMYQQVSNKDTMTHVKNICEFLKVDFGQFTIFCDTGKDEIKVIPRI